MIAAVEALPPAQRVVMLLVAVEGFSYREASEVLGVPIGTAAIAALLASRLRYRNAFEREAVPPVPVALQARVAELTSVAVASKELAWARTPHFPFPPRARRNP